MKDRMDGVVGALYNAFTSKETVYNPNDVLNLSLFNSEFSDGSLSSSEEIENFLPGVKEFH